jgi:uncharacterized RDD family membrane protein YckC
MESSPTRFYAPAPLGRRFLAFAIDAAIGGLPVLTLGAAFVGVWIVALGGPYWGWDGVERVLQDVTTTSAYAFFALWLLVAGLSFVWFVVYSLLRDSFGRGQSWGKRLLGLGVVEADSGLPCGRKASALRNLPGLLLTGLGTGAALLLPICGAVFFLGEPLAVLIDDERLRLGDHLARTRVVTAGRARHHLRRSD